MCIAGSIACFTQPTEGYEDRMSRGVHGFVIAGASGSRFAKARFARAHPDIAIAMPTLPELRFRRVKRAPHPPFAQRREGRRCETSAGWVTAI